MNELGILTRFLADELPDGSIGAVRPILEGDECLLTSTELAGMAASVVCVRRASGAARALARELCGRLGSPAAEIPRSLDRSPLWPPAIVRSINHHPSLTPV